MRRPFTVEESNCVELLPVLRHYVQGIDPDTRLSDRTKYDAAIRACGYDVSLPWDAVANQKILEAMPDVYRHPTDDAESNKTAFSGIVGDNTAFDPKELTTCIDVTTWPSETLMLAESESREPWTKPVDVCYSANAVVPRLGGLGKDGFLTISCDGAVHFVSNSVAPKSLRAYITKDQSGEFRIKGIPYRYR